MGFLNKEKIANNGVVNFNKGPLDARPQNCRTEEDKHQEYNNTMPYKKPFVISERLRNKAINYKNSSSENKNDVDSGGSFQGHKNLRANFTKPAMQPNGLGGDNQRPFRYSKEESEESVKFYLPNSQKQSP